MKEIAYTEDYMLLVSKYTNEEKCLVTNGRVVFKREDMSIYSNEYAERYWL